MPTATLVNDGHYVYVSPGLGTFNDNDDVLESYGPDPGHTALLRFAVSATQGVTLPQTFLRLYVTDTDIQSGHVLYTNVQASLEDDAAWPAGATQALQAQDASGRDVGGDGGTYEFNPSSAGKIHLLDVTAVLQLIVNRDGWPGDGHVLFYIGLGSGYSYFVQFASSESYHPCPALVFIGNCSQLLPRADVNATEWAAYNQAANQGSVWESVVEDPSLVDPVEAQSWAWLTGDSETPLGHTCELSLGLLSRLAETFTARFRAHGTAGVDYSPDTVISQVRLLDAAGEIIADSGNLYALLSDSTEAIGPLIELPLTRNAGSFDLSQVSLRWLTSSASGVLRATIYGLDVTACGLPSAVSGCVRELMMIDATIPEVNAEGWSLYGGATTYLEALSAVSPFFFPSHGLGARYQNSGEDTNQISLKFAWPANTGLPHAMTLVLRVKSPTNLAAGVYMVEVKYGSSQIGVWQGDVEFYSTSAVHAFCLRMDPLAGETVPEDPLELEVVIHVCGDVDNTPGEDQDILLQAVSLYYHAGDGNENYLALNGDSSRAGIDVWWRSDNDSPNSLYQIVDRNPVVASGNYIRNVGAGSDPSDEFTPFDTGFTFVNSAIPVWPNIPYALCRLSVVERTMLRFLSGVWTGGGDAMLAGQATHHLHADDPDNGETHDPHLCLFLMQASGTSAQSGLGYFELGFMPDLGDRTDAPITPGDIRIHALRFYTGAGCGTPQSGSANLAGFFLSLCGPQP